MDRVGERQVQEGTQKKQGSGDRAGTLPGTFGACFPGCLDCSCPHSPLGSEGEAEAQGGERCGLQHVGDPSGAPGSSWSLPLPATTHPSTPAPGITGVSKQSLLCRAHILVSDPDSPSHTLQRRKQPGPQTGTTQSLPQGTQEHLTWMGVTEDFLEQVTSDSTLWGGVEKLAESLGSDIQGPGFKSPLSRPVHVTQTSDPPTIEWKTREMAVPPPRAAEE